MNPLPGGKQIVEADINSYTGLKIKKEALRIVDGEEGVFILDGNTVLFVGSEGGFSEEEVCKAKELGYNVVTLGRRILRVETAAISAITLLLDAVGDIC